MIPYDRKQFTGPNQRLLALSVLLQAALALFFGHLYDMRIFMATGYLVGSGQGPYLARDLSGVFHNASFQGITSLGYPPPWALILGIIYLLTYKIIPNLLFYNLAIKIPIIAANLCLAYLGADVVRLLGAPQAVSRKAWIFLLFNPFVLYFASAWGQFDSIVALLSLLALLLLYRGKFTGSAILLALAISFKPTALPILPVALVFLTGKSLQQALRYALVCLAGMLSFCILPFIVFRWDPSPILQHWNAHFTVAGGMSLLTFLELLKNSYKLSGLWWLLGLAWIPALGVSLLALRHGIDSLADLLKKSTGLILVFFLTRAWLSEQNILLILPLVLILACVGELNGLALAAVWILPLVFTIFNASLPQLFFPSLPQAMDRMLKLADDLRIARLVIRTVLIIPWQVAGWWIVITCLRRTRPSLAEVSH